MVKYAMIYRDKPLLSLSTNRYRVHLENIVAILRESL